VTLFECVIIDCPLAALPSKTMETESEFDLMTYSELRFQAKQFGVKANLKTDKLKKELRRVSMLGCIGSVAKNEDDDDEVIRDPLAAPVSLPTKTPAHVTRRKHSRVPAPPESRSSKRPENPVSCVPTFHVESAIAVGVSNADRTMADPLGELRGSEDVRAYLSDDEDAEDGKTKTVNLSAFLSEGEEEEEDVDKAPLGQEATKEDPPNDLKLERQKTFEMESPSANVRPPLARQRTFEMESPTIDSPRPPLARRRTFEKESPVHLPSAPLATRRRTFDKQSPSAASRSSEKFHVVKNPDDASTSGPQFVRENTFDKESNDDVRESKDISFKKVQDAGVKKTDVNSVFGMEMPDSPNGTPMDFSILRDETSGLSAEELKARIMASIAVTPSTALTMAGSSSRKIGNEEGKSVSKDWKAIHSTNEKGMESVVDFYQRKRKRAEEAAKSVQKSAAKIAGVAAASKEQTTGKSVRALAFPKNRPNGAPSRGANADSRAKSSTTGIPTLSKIPGIKTAVAKNSAPPAKRVRGETSSKTLAAQSLKRARAAISSPAIKRTQAGNEPNSKRIKTTTTMKDKLSAASQAASGASKGHLFVPTVLSTKNMSLNFGAAAFKSRAPAVPPVVKNAGNAAGAASLAAGSRAKATTSVTKVKVPASTILPSLPKVGGDRRISPRVNRSVAVSVPGNSAVTSSSSATPNVASKKDTTPFSRLAPSRNTTPGKVSASGTPASASRQRKTPLSQQKSPWIPAGIATPKFNFARTSAAENTENLFKFTAVGAAAGNQQQTSLQQRPVKKFDLKESLKQKLKYKPHRGPLKGFEEEKPKASAMNKKQFRR